LVPLRFRAGDFFRLLLRLFDFFAVVLPFPRDLVAAFRDLLARAFDFGFDRRDGFDFLFAELRDLAEAFERDAFVLDFEGRAFLELLLTDGFATDLTFFLAFVTVFLAAGSIGFRLAAACPARAPSTPPTTVPIGPATLPITAPAAAPAVGFEIGGISIFSDPPESSLGFSFCSSAIRRVAPVDVSR
jgi:hypothetical protein